MDLCNVETHSAKIGQNSPPDEWVYISRIYTINIQAFIAQNAANQLVVEFSFGTS